MLTGKKSTGEQHLRYLFLRRSTAPYSQKIVLLMEFILLLKNNIFIGFVLLQLTKVKK
jgi:hypothetical protein